MNSRTTPPSSAQSSVRQSAPSSIMAALFSTVKLMRPHQWTKNVFVLAGLFFGEGWRNTSLVAGALLAFVAFCLVSSAGYCLNDVMDVQKDRAHPWKKKRPLASGQMSRFAASSLGLTLAAAGLGLGFLSDIRVAFILLAYLVLNALYSLRLKELVLVDVFCIALGFMLRVLAGTSGIGIEPSHWLMLCTMVLSLFLGFSKRYAELIDDLTPMADKRPVLRNYSREFLHTLLSVSLSASVITYGLYTMSPRTMEVHGTGNLIYTLPVVMFGLFRYLYLVLRGRFGENTVADMARDGQILTSVGLYVVAVLFIIFRTLPDG